jgi:hypothetical protein
MSYNRQYTPWIDDPDPPDRMTREESKAAAQKLAVFLRQKARKPRSQEELIRDLMAQHPGLTEAEARRDLEDFGGH